jgi:heat shock protein HslJ
MRGERRRPVPTLVASIAAVLFLLVACGSDSDSGDDSSGGSDSAPTQSDLDGSTFTATSKTGSGLVEDSTITLSFEDGTMAVQAGCNNQSAAYEVDGGTLKWTSSPAGTLMACPPELEAQDAVLSDMFTSGVTASLDGTTLTLTDDDVKLVLGQSES